jgi:arabinose-5-phosphate isomerase
MAGKEKITKILQTAKTTIKLEKETIENLINQVNNEFAEAVYEIYKSRGRVIITGVGKSAIIGKKIVATLNSTGTPAIFMHATEAIHGDLGIMQPTDIVIFISKSGNTPEIKNLLNIVKDMGNKIIAIVGDKNSFLAKNSNYVIYTPVEKEACPNNLAPTSSTTAQLVMGDAIAASLIELKGFTSEDFAKFHPGGSLGKKLLYKVETLMNIDPPKVFKDTPIKDVILEISGKRMGATAIVDSTGKKVLGIITDGDIRRMLEKNNFSPETKAADIMTPNPKKINKKLLASAALQIMETYSITQLIVVDDNDEYVGMIHLHDILKEGIK